jgi:hypothetical protein
MGSEGTLHIFVIIEGQTGATPDVPEMCAIAGFRFSRSIPGSNMPAGL